MVACGCFSSGSQSTKRPSTSGYAHQASFPQPPPKFQDDDTKDIYTRITEVISPIDAERNTATVNKKAKRSVDFDEEAGFTGSRHALLAQPSGGFTRTCSLGAAQNSLDLRRAISDRSVLGGPSSIPSSAVWTESRKELELAIQAEKAKDHADWNPDLQSEEQRLRKRLSKLNLEMKVMVGDGNCQFRAVSFGLYGSQEYHQSVRQKAVEYMRLHKENYAAFLGENIDDYLHSMEHTGTWGDELTLRAISDYWGIVINVVTSDQHNWFMRYKPPKIRLLLEIFLTYIAPVHYNAIRRQTVTGALRSTLSRQTSSSIDMAMKRAFSAERALASSKLAPDVREALRTGQKMDALYNGSEVVANGDLPAARDSFQRRRTMEKPMDSVAEGLDEGRVSMQSTSHSTDAATPPSRRANVSEPALADASELAAVGNGSGAELFENPLAGLAVQPPPDVPVSAFAAQASHPLGQQLHLNSSKPEVAVSNGHYPVQSYQTLLN